MPRISNAWSSTSAVPYAAQLTQTLYLVASEQGVSEKAVRFWGVSTVRSGHPIRTAGVSGHVAWMNARRKRGALHFRHP